MASTFPVIVFSIFLQLFLPIEGTKYFGRPDDIKDCPGKEGASPSDFFDTNHIGIDWTDNGNLVVNGYTTFLGDIDPKQKIELLIKTAKRVGTKWTSTPSLTRKDSCATFMDPEEIWYPLVKDFVGDQRLCPLKKGTRYEFHNRTFEFTFDCPPGMEGEYMLTILVKSKEADFCVVCTVFAVKM